MGALVAGFWGFVGGAALLVWALVGLYAGASQRTVSIVMAVRHGVLISRWPAFVPSKVEREADELEHFRP